VGTGIIIGWFNLLGAMHVHNGWYLLEMFARILLSVFPGGWLTLDMNMAHLGEGGPEHAMDFLNIGNAYGVLASPNIWIGVVAGAAMLAGAIWFRRWRDDS
jgi:ABC-2 type transport system permease protein